MKNFLFFFFLPIFLLANQKNQELCITNIEKINDKYIITFNDAIVVKDIKVIKAKDKYEIYLPFYITDNGKKYQQVSILDKNLYKKILDAVIYDKVEKNYIRNNPKFRINKFYENEFSDSKIKVFASVIFGESLEIECKILQTKYGLLIIWPSKKENNSWISIIDFRSQKYKEKIERELLSRYKVHIIEFGK